VPAYPLGTKHPEYSEIHHIPFDATQGGAETMYPEYAKRIQELLKAQPARPSTTSTQK
jgi:hypothetical protein